MIRRLLAAALLVVGSPCAAQTPVIQVYDSARGRPVLGARLVAYGVHGHDTTRAQADSDGTFRSPTPGPEPYVIRIRALGYWPRVDTLILDAGQPRRIGLLVQVFCNGPCPPDPYRVTAARAAWGCATDTIEIATRRVWWLSQLGSSAFQGSLDGVPSLNGLRMRPAVVTSPASSTTGRPVAGRPLPWIERGCWLEQRSRCSGTAAIGSCPKRGKRPSSCPSATVLSMTSEANRRGSARAPL